METLSPNLKKLWKFLPHFIRKPDPNIYRSENYVLVDLETTNKDKGSPYCKENILLFASFRLGRGHPDFNGEHTFFKWGSEYEQQEMVNFCENADFIIAHNTKFEIGWFSRCGLDTSRHVFYCTQIGEYVIAGNRKWKFNLEDTLARRGLGSKISTTSKLLKNGTCLSTLPKKWVQTYGIMDTEKEHELFLQQREDIFKDGLEGVQFTRCLFTPPIVHMESTGVHLDKKRVEVIAVKLNKELRILQAEMDTITGGINTNSPDQKADFLYNVLKFPIPKDFRGNEVRGKKKNDMWPEGLPSTATPVIQRLRATTNKQKKFLSLISTINKVKNAKSKTIDKFLDCVTETEDCILTASLNQTLTGTHRLSSTGKNYKAQFQNFPREYKPLFSARNKDWLIGEIDEASLEYRGAVFLGDDEAGYYDINHKVDAHSLTASIVFKKEWADCGGDRKSSEGKRIRTEAKSRTFKPLYAGKSGTDSERKYYKWFQEKHKGITKKQEDWKKEVYTTRKLRTITGLTFYWEDATLNRKGTLIRPDGRPVDQALCNYPVQSFSTAEIVPVAVSMQWHLMKVAKMQSFLVNTVHDSSVSEVHPKEVELFEELGVYSFTSYIPYYLKEVYDIDFTKMPLEAEVEINRNWADSPTWREEHL